MRFTTFKVNIQLSHLPKTRDGCAPYSGVQPQALHTVAKMF